MKRETEGLSVGKEGVRDQSDCFRSGMPKKRKGDVCGIGFDLNATERPCRT